MLNVALPKGRLGDSVYTLFNEIGYECKEILSDSRALEFTDASESIRFLLVKPSDVGVYVERGAADIGVCGSDILDENGNHIFELMDLHLGVCKLAVAAKVEYQEDANLPLRVATKYPNIAKKYFESVGRNIEIIKLNGSIELAPILGLSDVIVDIVETGTTLKENDLEVKHKIKDVSARLIANKSSFQFKKESIENIVEKLEKNIKN